MDQTQSAPGSQDLFSQQTYIAEPAHQGNNGCDLDNIPYFFNRALGVVGWYDGLG